MQPGRCHPNVQAPARAEPTAHSLPWLPHPLSKERVCLGPCTPGGNTTGRRPFLVALRLCLAFPKFTKCTEGKAVAPKSSGPSLHRTLGTPSLCGLLGAQGRSPHSPQACVPCLSAHCHLSPLPAGLALNPELEPWGIFCLVCPPGLCLVTSLVVEKAPQREKRGRQARPGKGGQGQQALPAPAQASLFSPQHEQRQRGSDFFFWPHQIQDNFAELLATNP